MATNNIPSEYLHADIKNIKNCDTIFDWVRDQSKRFLFISGDVGTGKTYLVCAIKKRCNEINYPCRLIFCSDLTLKIRDSFNSEEDSELRIIHNVSPDKNDDYDHFAIFDDFGFQKPTEYTKEVWYHIIDRRQRFGYRTIITSNLTLEEISDTYGDRLSSRIGAGEVFGLVGTDRRIEDIDSRDLTKIF